MFRLSFKIIIFVTFISLSLFTYSNAQVVNTAVSGIDISVSTSNPTPGQQVKVTAKSYVININSATVLWKVNGTEVKRGVGETEITVTAPSLGKKTIVSVVAITPDGKTVSNEITLGSGSIDMILETSGYTPPFFMGKLSPVFQNKVKIIAMPHLASSDGTEYSPENLVYKWEKDGRVVENASGYGKQSLEVEGSIIPRPTSIMLTVTTRDGMQKAKTIKEINYNDANILFYKNDPVYGPMFNREIGETVYINNQKEVGILAVPFGFDKPLNDLGNLALSWFINDTKRDDLASKESIIIRSPEGSYGTSDISLKIENKANILQGVEGGFSVSFKASTKNSSEKISF